MRRSLVIGAGGQDGRILCEQLRARGDHLGAVNRSGTLWTGSAAIGHLDVHDDDRVRDVIRAFVPDEVYFLAAIHQSSEGRAAIDPEALEATSFSLHLDAARRVMQALVEHAPGARFFYASSSHVFAQTDADVIDEQTPPAPEGVYGRSKAAGFEAVREYRSRGLFAVAGHLFPHESPHRAPHYLSQRVVRGLVQVKRGTARELVVGDLAARADWGWAADHTRAMSMLLAHDEPLDAAVATGELHSVRDWVHVACDRLALDPARIVREDRALLTRSTRPLRADVTRLTKRLGWTPSIDFAGLVRRLVDAALDSESA